MMYSFARKRRNAPAGENRLAYIGILMPGTPDMAKKEAQYCAETIEEYKIFGPVVFIFSEDSSRYVQSRGIAVTEKLKKELVYAFCKAMKEYGYDAEGRADAN